MKRFQLVVLLGFCGAMCVQSQTGSHKPITYRDSAKNPRIVVQGNEGFLKPGDSFELSGAVQIRQVEEQTTLTCSKATGKFVNVGGKNEVDDVKLSGGVKMTQVTLDDQGAQKSTVSANGSRASYDLKDSLREVTLSDEVVINFSGDQARPATKTSTATDINSDMKTIASSATLVFKKKTDAKTKKDTAEMQSAVIAGPIQFTGHQIVKQDDKVKVQKVTAKADRMTYTISGESKHPEVRLEGNLEFHEEGDDGAVVEGANLLILELNDKFEIVRLKFSSGSGSQVKTTVSKGVKGGA